MIKNGKNTLLNENSGTLPDVSGAMRNWFQQMTFIKLVKSLVNFRVVESEEIIKFQGIIQIFTDQQLQMKPEGQRDWKWYSVHSETPLQLITDDKITYLCKDYRVMNKGDYTQYGFVKYEVVEGYAK